MMMTLEEARDRYPEIDALLSFIKTHGLKLEALDLTPELVGIHFSLIRIQSDKINLTVRVEDEHDDALNGTPALLLQMVFNSCDEYDEQDDFLVWSKAVGLVASDSQSLSIYKEIAETASLMSDLGVDYSDYISAYDWELNAGAAQALRNLSK